MADSAIRVRNGEDILSFWPVGSIYMSVNSTSPATFFGGTWERITGRFLLAATDGGASGGNSNASIAPGGTGGEASHTLAIAEMPNHRHEVGARNAYGSGNAGGSISYGSSVATGTNYTNYVGGGDAHNNMPPYLSVYMWKRTA